MLKLVVYKHLLIIVLLAYPKLKEALIIMIQIIYAGYFQTLALSQKTELLINVLGTYFVPLTIHKYVKIAPKIIIIISLTFHSENSILEFVPVYVFSG